MLAVKIAPLTDASGLAKKLQTPTFVFCVLLFSYIFCRVANCLYPVFSCHAQYYCPRCSHYRCDEHIHLWSDKEHMNAAFKITSPTDLHSTLMAPQIHPRQCKFLDKIPYSFAYQPLFLYKALYKKDSNECKSKSKIGKGDASNLQDGGETPTGLAKFSLFHLTSYGRGLHCQKIKPGEP